MRQALDDLDEIVLGVESLGLAVGQQGVEERVVGTGPGIAEEEVVFRAELGGPDFVLGEVMPISSRPFSRQTRIFSRWLMV